MMLLVAGSFLILMGLFAGAVLVIAPLGFTDWSAAPVLWVLFPLFSFVGYALFVIGARNAQVRTLSMVVSGLMLLLAMCSAAALVLDAASVVQPVSGTLSFWYVLVGAGLLGCIGAASYGRQRSDDEAAAPR